MLKIKIKDNPDYVISNIKRKDDTILEGIVLLDMAIELLEDVHLLSDEKIWELLKDYRNNLKEVEEYD